MFLASNLWGSAPRDTLAASFHGSITENKEVLMRPKVSVINIFVLFSRQFPQSLQ